MILPSTRAPGITSCIRFSDRSMVDLPQPDGPMNAVTDRALMVMLTPCDGEEVAVVDVEVGDVDALGHGVQPFLTAKIRPMRRAIRLSAITMTMRTSAAPQARAMPGASVPGGASNGTVPGWVNE